MVRITYYNAFKYKDETYCLGKIIFEHDYDELYLT